MKIKCQSPPRLPRVSQFKSSKSFHSMHGVGTQNRKLSRLNDWPMRTPVNASPRPSRAPRMNSGPMWTATPSSQETCTLYSLPVSRRFAYPLCQGERNEVGRSRMPIARQIAVSSNDTSNPAKYLIAAPFRWSWRFATDHVLTYRKEQPPSSSLGRDPNHPICPERS